MHQARSVLSVQSLQRCAVTMLLLLTSCVAVAAEAVPAITAGVAQTIKPAILAAAKAGQKTIVIPKGTYRIPAFDGRWFLELRDLVDLDIDGREATLVLDGPWNGFIELWRCRGVTVRGLTLLHDPMPFTQGRIEAFGADEKSLDLRIAAGFPARFDDPKLFSDKPPGYVFDALTRLWKPGCGDLYSDRVERLSDGLFRLHYGNRIGPSAQPIAVGDMLAFRGKGLTDIHVADCANCTIDGVTIRSGGGFCVHEDGGDGGNHYTYTVTYGPRPNGASENPLIACNADAFHSSNARIGPTVTNCRFEGMCDDGIAIHGAFALALAAKGDAVVITERSDWRVGDHLQFIDLTGGLAGEAVIAARRPRPDFKPVGKSRYRPYEDLDRRRFMELDLDQAIPAAFDWLVSNSDTNGSGYVLRGNLIRNHRARGMLLKADHGVVENNTIDGSTIAGIVLSPEFWWNEAGCSNDVLIKGNTIRNTGYATHVGAGQRQAGALTLCGEAEPAARPGHRHIRIENNTFRDCDGTNLLIDFAVDVGISGNTFVNPMRTPVQRGADHIEDLGALIYIGAHTFDVRLKDNQVNNPGNALVREVGVAKTAGNVIGIKPDRK